MLPNPPETADLLTFTQEFLNRKLHFFVQCCLKMERTLYFILQFSPNAGKYGPEEPRIRTLFTQYQKWKLHLPYRG